MRMMVKVTIGAKAGNQGIKDGSLPKTMEAFMQQHKPEAAYFTTEGGERTAFFVINMADGSAMPSVAEPFFQALGAEVDFRPVMNADELRAGLQKLPH
jgi:hypothetical protein